MSARADAGQPAHTDTRLVCSGTFERVTADVRVVVRKENDKYKVLDLQVLGPGDTKRRMEGED